MMSEGLMKRIVAKSLLITLTMLLMVASGYPHGTGTGATPLEIIRRTNEEIASIYRQGTTTDHQINKRIDSLICGITAFDVMSRLTFKELNLGITPVQMENLQAAFQLLLRHSMMVLLDKYHAAQLNYLSQKREGQTVVVRVAIRNKDETILVDYQMAEISGVWKIVNYWVNGVGLVQNYRVQFIQLFKRKSYDSVQMLLRKKIADLEKRNERKDRSVEFTGTPAR